jgi:hypothetical protein
MYLLHIHYTRKLYQNGNCSLWYIDYMQIQINKKQMNCVSMTSHIVNNINNLDENSCT